MLPLFIGLTIFFNKDLKFNFLNIILIFLSFVLIFFTGERAAFFMALISCTLIFSYISLSIYFKTSLVLITISSIFFALILNPVIFDRYIQQLKTHIISDEKTQKFYVLYANV